MVGWIAAVVGALAAGVGAGYLLRRWMASVKTQAAEADAKAIAEKAQREAEEIRKEGKLQVKAELIKVREEFETSVKSRRAELATLEQRMAEREGNLDRKVAMLDRKEHGLDQRLAEVNQRAAEIDKTRGDLEKLIAEERDKLQKVAGLTRDQAKEMLLSKLESELHSEMGSLIRRMQEEAKDKAEREARNIIAVAVQRYASGHASEMMTSTVSLPNDEMKGRIIGREGRNIRSLEAATGVTVHIDDTPEAVVISCFDPVRREVARQSLDRLIQDGRIHPARIEEVVAKVQGEMDETIRSTGEQALYKVGLQAVDPELLRMVGRLRFRTSFTQNVLQHSIEVAELMGVMAAEMGLDPSLAKRIGMFHDIGKAVDHEVEGGHAIIGADYLKRHNEPQVLVNAVAAHHEEVQPESAYAQLAAAADAISSSRLGARSETTEIYVKRLEKLEAIATKVPGVKQCYAIQAGREIRVLVDPEQVDDNKAMIMARDISKQIEAELQYPGQIRVVVIRETRCVEFAR